MSEMDGDKDVKYVGPLAREMALRAKAEEEFGLLGRLKQAAKVVVSDPAGAGGNPYHDPGSGRFTGPGGGGAAGSAPVPAGWHPDPTGRHTHRFWDGTKWTEDVGDNGVQSKDADLTPKVVVPPPPPPPAPVAAAPAASGPESRADYLARVNATKTPEAEKKGFWAQAKERSDAKIAARAETQRAEKAGGGDAKKIRKLEKEIEELTKKQNEKHEWTETPNQAERRRGMIASQIIQRQNEIMLERGRK